MCEQRWLGHNIQRDHQQQKKKEQSKEYDMTPVPICSVEDSHEAGQPALPALLLTCSFTDVFSHQHL